ncbi:zinc carboxypeptidase A 1-like [Episyrphus balteatus]|uniref:zinc carboxypeptidase A 1-like n=1 Tax=Episyrphus balteatus TaxID=286459 RepID=UPI002485F90B|nr:zinc carboxypeptidase A 1-like [Episyrphus balteatus]
MSRTLLVLLLSCLLLALTNGLRIRYDNHRVYQVTAKIAKQLNVLKNLDGISDKLIFLDEVHTTGRPLSVIVAPTMLYKFLQTLDESEIEYKLVEENAQSKLESDEEVTKPLKRVMEYNWEQYHELNETYGWLESLVERFPEQVTLVEAGQTYEGRKIMGIKISYKEGNKGIFLEGGMHAREWIGPATVTYMTNQLLTSTDPEVRSIAENFDWYIVPHANPDGYVYSHTTDRVWRKTRTPYGKCFGADPNRNWDFYWNTVGSSDNPCSDTYAGPKAFSEIETKSFSEYIASVKENLMLYISYHSYSQLLLFPYGHTDELPSNYDDLKRVYDVAVKAIGRRYGTKYTGGNIYDAIYPASGASLDWAYGTLGVKYSYCYELRPSSTNLWYGFRLPAKQIIPTAEETLDSLVAMVKEVAVSN